MKIQLAQRTSIGLVFLAICACSKNTLRNVSQLDRIGRPFVNEVFLVTQGNNNLFSTLPPTSDLISASVGIQAEITEILTFIRSYATGVGLSAPTVSSLTTSYFPDVLRIDTTIASSPVGTWAYNKTATMGDGSLLLIGGRKLEDDVWDITGSLLFSGAVTGGPSTAVGSGADRVCYEGSASSRCSTANDRLQGHDKLYGATQYNGNASFPFLPNPN